MCCSNHSYHEFKLSTDMCSRALVKSVPYISYQIMSKTWTLNYQSRNLLCPQIFLRIALACFHAICCLLHPLREFIFFRAGEARLSQSGCDFCRKIQNETSWDSEFVSSLCWLYNVMFMHVQLRCILFWLLRTCMCCCMPLSCFLDLYRLMIR